MSFIDSIEEKVLIKKIEHTTYTLEIWEVTIDDEYFKLKFWKVLNNDKSDLIKEIWLNEVRQLNKLKSVTNADNFLESLYDHFIDDAGCFCLIYSDNGETLSLSSLKDVIENDQRISLGRRKKSLHWMHKDVIHEISNRVILWKNIIRLIKGVEILHSQGIIHRKINLDNILYDNSSSIKDTERFRLGGFEQSLNLSNLDSNNFSFVDDNEDTVFSLYVDWEMLGILVLEILNIDKDDMDESFLSHKEKNVISLLLYRKKSEFSYVVDVEKVKIDILDLVRDLPDFQKQGVSDLNYYITTISNPNTEFFQRLRNIVMQFTGSDNLTNEEFSKYLKNDLDTNNCIIRQPRNNTKKIYMIKGKNLIYQIKSYRPPKTIGESSEWYFAYIVNIFDTYPNWMDSSESYEFRGKLNFLTESQIKNSNNTLDSTTWRSIIAQFDEKQEFTDKELECLQGLLLSHAIEIALMFTEKYLVSFDVLDEIFIKKNSKYLVDDGTEYISIIYKSNEDKENLKLSNALMLPNPLDRLQSYFDRDLQDSEKLWILEPEENEYIDKKVEIRFEATIGKELIFSIKSNSIFPIGNSENFKFYPNSHLIGSDTQINRRTNAFYRLLEQRSLVSSLVDPSGSNRVTRLKHDIEDSLKDLDTSKADVFKQLMSTTPNFFIEGPPGVGKTYLITTYINQIFKDEPSSKILLSSQSHDTVRTLAEDVNKKFDTKNLIVIDAFKDYQQDEPKLVEKISNPYINQFFDSEMCRDALQDSSPNIRSELKKLSSDRLSYPLFNNILKSANIIFSTTNHKILEDMIKESVYFDISVMEESAKVSGIELISPMLVSSKRVLIGDYLQLPAFLEQVIDRINKNYLIFDYELILKQLLKIRFRKDIFRILGLEHIVDDRSQPLSPEHRDKMMKSLSRYFSLFKSLSIDAKEVKKRDSLSFGDIINIQHRMHPHISKIVSKTVYNDRLLDNDKKAEIFLSFTPIQFKKSKIKGLNVDKAVVWVDIPDKNSEKQMIESYENDRVNNAEIKVIKEILSKLTPIQQCDNNDTELYKVQILSPYKNQVRELNNTLRNINIEEGLVFDKPIARTVDSFQGNEADIIIISLVRHNTFTPVTKALGFLMDMRRMNVLLSRAKHKMIIVGCFKMFKYWSDKLNQSNLNFDNDENIEFLKNFVDLCEPDYTLMINNNQNNTKSNFIHFVSSRDFLDVSKNGI